MNFLKLKSLSLLLFTIVISGLYYLGLRLCLVLLRHMLRGLGWLLLQLRQARSRWSQ